MNEKFINPKLQKYSKYEIGYAEKKKNFRQKNHPKPLMFVRSCKIGCEEKTAEF